MFNLLCFVSSILKVSASNASGPKELGSILFSGNGFIQTLVDMLIKLPFIIFPIMIIVGGFMYMMSAGNEQNMKKAQATITWGIIGFLITMLAFGLVILVKKLVAPGANVNPTSLPKPVF